MLLKRKSLIHKKIAKKPPDIKMSMSLNKKET